MKQTRRHILYLEVAELKQRKEIEKKEREEKKQQREKEEKERKEREGKERKLLEKKEKERRRREKRGQDETGRVIESAEGKGPRKKIVHVHRCLGEGGGQSRLLFSIAPNHDVNAILKRHFLNGY